MSTDRVLNYKYPQCPQGDHSWQRSNFGLRYLWRWLRNGYVYDRCFICDDFDHIERGALGDEG